MANVAHPSPRPAMSFAEPPRGRFERTSASDRNDDVEMLQYTADRTSLLRGLLKRNGLSPFQGWLSAMTPLIVQVVMAFLISAFMLLYVNGRTFNVNDRRARYTEADGTIGEASHWRLVQTDVTTALSVALAVSRLFAGAWATSCCWRCAFILLETTGMRYKDFRRLLSFGMPTIARTPTAPSGMITMLVVGFIISAAIPAQFAAPLLTGSITWVAHDDMDAGQKPLSNVPVAWDVSNNWQLYMTYTSNRLKARVQAAGVATMMWSNDRISTNRSRRFIENSGALSINTTLHNVTIPYFTINSLQWINPDTLSSTDQQATRASDLCNVSDYRAVGDFAGTMCIFPDESFRDYYNSWSWTGINGWPLPSKVVSKSAVLMVMANRKINTTCTITSDTFNVLPDSGFKEDLYDNGNHDCYMFANLTYTAGVMTCYDCVVVAPQVIESKSPVNINELEEDRMTLHALYLMAEVTSTLVDMNLSLPLAWNNFENYTQELLFRSYFASWTALTSLMGDGGPSLSTSVAIAVPTSRARVALWRVYLWFGLQGLFMLSAVAFIGLQRSAEMPLVKNPTMEVFLLDASEVRQQLNRHGGDGDSDMRRRIAGVMRLRKEDDFSVIHYERH